MGKNFFKWIFIITLVVVLSAGGRFYYFINSSASSVSQNVIFEIPPGDSFNNILKNLSANNLISNIELFRLYVYFNKGIKLIKAGEYSLNTKMTPIQIYDILISGRSILYNITIPEGYNIYQIAELLDSKKIGSKERFLDLVQDPHFINDLQLQGRSLEGYLFPSTYKVAKSITTKKLIETFVSKFKKEFTPELIKRAEEIGFSEHQVVTLASIVEKETGDPRERPTIASVFHNRLKKRMRLESDPTVIYGIKNFNGNLKRAHLKQRTPYNTYRIFGLPEGPIANPGIEAIKAVLWPKETPYLYFVSMNNGSHVFTKTYKEHQKEVFYYQKLRRNRKGKSWRDLKKRLDK